MMEIKLGKFPDLFPPGNETMATNGKLIWVDEDYIAKLKLPEAVFVMSHEVGHAMFMHMSRGKFYSDAGFDGQPFNAKLWNVSGDYVINDMLIESKVGKMPKQGLHDTSKGSAGDLVDDVYRKILQNQPPPPKGKGSGKNEPGQGDADGKGHGGFDTHVLDVAKESEVEWKRAVKSAADGAKAVGKMPAGLERYVDDLLAPKVKWTEMLRSAMVKVLGRDATNWARPNRRRLITQGVIMPSYQGYGCGCVVFCVDTSGSMSDKEIAQALSECDDILTDCNPKEVILIGCDARVETVHHLGPGDTLKGSPPETKLGGGGGTSFIPPFDYLEEHCISPECLVYFTDMGGSFPTVDPGFKTIWCATTDYGDPAFGQVIRVDMSE